MMRLAELDAEERSWLQSGRQDGELQELAERLRQGLLASLGREVSVGWLPVKLMSALIENKEPVIKIEPELAAAWLVVRLGGKAEARYWPVRDAALLEPFYLLIRRALAQAVINLGENALWPEVLRLQVTLGQFSGVVEIVWSGGRAMAWARSEIRGKR